MTEFIENMINRNIEQRMLEIEQMDKKGLSLDDQFKLIEEYNKLWDKMNKK